MGNLIQDILGLIKRRKPVTPRDKDIFVMARQKQQFKYKNIQESPDLDDQLTTVKQLTDYIVAKVPNELPNPGTEGQVLALDSSLDPIWKDDADTTTTSFSITGVDAAIGSALGDKLIPEKTDTSGLTVGNPYYLSNNSGETDLTAVSDITSSTAMSAAIGLAVGTTSASGILVRGLIRLNADLQPGATLYFVNNSLSATAPSTTGQYVRIAGYVLQKVDATNSIVYFNPSQDFILLS